MRKQYLSSLFIALACTLSMGVWSACDSGNSSPATVNELSGFSTETKTDTGELGGIYTVEELAPIDSNQKFYDVDVTVTKDGESVQLVGGGFELAALGEYVITYALNFNGETLKKLTTVTVSDTLAPTVERGNVPEKIQQGDIVDLSSITARDWSEITALTKTVTLNGQEITLSNDTFTATESGVYTVTVYAKDAANNQAEQAFAINCMKKGELYNFESPVAAAEIYGATTMEYTAELPEDNTTSGLKITFANAWQPLYFRDLNTQMLADKAKEGFNTFFFDVYYQGGDTTSIWLTPFGTKSKNMRSNVWTTVEVPLSALASATEKTSYIAFNVDGTSAYPHSSYTVYLDNIRVEKVVEKEKLYDGFENDTATNQGWRHVTWYTGIAIATAQTDIVYDGVKSLKITSTQSDNYVHLRDGNSVQLDNAWIQARAGKTLYFWVYYKNDTKTDDCLTVEVKDGADGAVKAYSQQHAQGEWVQVSVSLDDIASFSKITVSIHSENLSSGAVYFDSFEIY